MRFLLLLFLLSVSYIANAGDLVRYHPEEVKEYEDFRIKLHDIPAFKISLSNSCLSIWHMENVTETDGIYSSKNGVLMIENKCFENDKVEIEIKTDKKSEKIDLLIQPRAVEEQDYSC